MAELTIGGRDIPLYYSALEMIEIAEESGIVLLATKKRMYEACGTQYANGLGANHTP